jgi:CheY-like chemotaxis protein
VILLDFYLPGKNGAEFLQLIRTKGIEWPVICISVSQDYRIVQEFLRCEADDYIAKEQLNNGYAIEKVISAVLDKEAIPKKSCGIADCSPPYGCDYDDHPDGAARAEQSAGNHSALSLAASAAQHTDTRRTWKMP